MAILTCQKKKDTLFTSVLILFLRQSQKTNLYRSVMLVVHCKVTSELSIQYEVWLHMHIHWESMDSARQKDRREGSTDD
jgi:hypothetical protein